MKQFLPHPLQGMSGNQNKTTFWWTYFIEAGLTDHLSSVLWNERSAKTQTHDQTAWWRCRVLRISLVTQKQGTSHSQTSSSVPTVDRRNRFTDAHQRFHCFLSSTNLSNLRFKFDSCVTSISVPRLPCAATTWLDDLGTTSLTCPR